MSFFPSAVAPNTDCLQGSPYPCLGTTDLLYEEVDLSDACMTRWKHRRRSKHSEGFHVKVVRQRLLSLPLGPEHLLTKTTFTSAVLTAPLTAPTERTLRRRIGKPSERKSDQPRRVQMKVNALLYVTRQHSQCRLTFKYDKIT